MPRWLRIVLAILSVIVIVLGLNLLVLYPFLRSTEAQQNECWSIIIGAGDSAAKDPAIARLWELTRLGDPVCAKVAGNLATIMDRHEASGSDYGDEFGVVLWSIKILEENSLDPRHVPVLERISKFKPHGDGTAARLMQLKATVAGAEIAIRYAQRALERYQDTVHGISP